MHHKRFRPPSVLYVLAVSGGIACSGAPSERPLSRTTQSRLVLAETPRCSVALGQLSYDDPDADDAEYIQLVVHGGDTPDGAATPTPPPPAGTDAGSGCGVAEPPASFAPEASPLTLGDCGLESLVLLNGGTEGCPVYRSLALAAVPVPADGLVLICSSSSTIAASAGCDVTHEGTRALPNSWIQNGPNDGLRFSTVNGPIELAYEGALAACFETEPSVLVTESGSAPDGTDDVNVACQGIFALSSGVDPRQAPSCASQSPEAGVASAASGVDVARDASAPSTAAGPGYGTVDQTFSAEPGRILLPPIDAGYSVDPEGVPLPPSLGCSVTGLVQAPAGGVRIIVVLAALAALGRRRVRRRPGSRWARARSRPPCAARGRRRAARSGASRLR